MSTTLPPKVQEEVWRDPAVELAHAHRTDNVLGEAQTAAAMLLLVPALIAGFLIAPGEHPMTRHLPPTVENATLAI